MGVWGASSYSSPQVCFNGTNEIERLTYLLCSPLVDLQVDL